MPSYIYNMVDNWNAGATTFTAIKMNVTDTASAAASLLMDLQVGGASRFSVSKAGAATFGGSITVTAAGSYVNAAGLSLGTSGAGGIFVSGGNAFVVNSSGGFRWSSNANVNVDIAGDLILTRRAAANLRLGAADAAAPVAQTLSVQSVVAGTTDTAGANLTITGSQGTGTGAGGSILFQVAPAGSTGTAQNALSTALTINSAGLLSVTPASSSSSSIHALRGSISTPAYSFSTDTSSGAFFGAYNGLNSYQLSISGNLQWTVGQSGGGTTQLGPVSWAAASGNSLAAPDLYLARDAADTLAQRRGTNAQAFRVYNTFTDASNYERLATYWAGNTAYILSASAGTGVARNLVVGTALSSTLAFWTAAVERWQINTSGHFVAGADNTYDIGASGASRPRNIFAAGQLNGLYIATLAASLNGNGGVYFGATGTGAQIQATAVGVLALANYAGTDFSRLQFGGTTSSFPALKRSSTVLQSRLADDSDFAPLQGQLRSHANAVAETPTATHTITIYDAAGTAYKVLCVAA